MSLTMMLILIPECLLVGIGLIALLALGLLAWLTA